MEMEHSQKKLRVLVIERDEPTRSACMEIATRKGFWAEGVSDGGGAQELLHGYTPDLVLMDLEPNRVEDLQVLEEIKTVSPKTAIIAMSTAATIPFSVETMYRGATDVLAKPFLMEQLEMALDQALQQGRTRSFTNLVAPNQEMDALNRMLAKVAQTRHPALIVGESGTGKETVARTIHEQSEFASHPFLTVECSALPPGQIEQELFGCIDGTLSGSLSSTSGVLVAAKHGTVFLDEIGHLTPDLQAKLMRVLQEKEIRAADSIHRVIPFQARLLAASSIDLSGAVTKGAFRKDLYYRLNVVTLRIPPLRERPSDIPQLAAHFLEHMSRETGQHYTLSEEAMCSMQTYDWPNNIRELKNMIERACTLADGPLIQIIDLPTLMRTRELELRREKSSQMQKTLPEAIQPVSPLKMKSLAELEKEAILTTVEQVNGDKLLAAQLLGIGKTTMYRKLKEYGAEKAISVHG